VSEERSRQAERTVRGHERADVDVARRPRILLRLLRQAGAAAPDVDQAAQQRHELEPAGIGEPDAAAGRTRETSAGT
jgi:hypothetical protein